MAVLSAWPSLCLSLRKGQTRYSKQAYRVQNPAHQPEGYPPLFRVVGLQTPDQALSAEPQILWHAFPATEPEPEPAVQIVLHSLSAVFASHCHGLAVVENLLLHDFLSVDVIVHSSSRYLGWHRAELVVFALEAGHLLVGLVYFVGLRGWRGPSHGDDCGYGERSEQQELRRRVLTSPVRPGMADLSPSMCSYTPLVKIRFTD